MEAMEVLKKRRSVRAFQDNPIAIADLESLIDVARFAPTARNVQPWEFVVVTDKKVLTKIANLAENGRFISGAGACIAVFCAETKYYLEDGCAATVNILNAAAALGLGSCWVAGDKKDYADTVLQLLNLPSGYKLISLIALGYPKDKDAFRVADKRPLKELMHWERF